MRTIQVVRRRGREQASTLFWRLKRRFGAKGEEIILHIDCKDVSLWVEHSSLTDGGAASYEVAIRRLIHILVNDHGLSIKLYGTLLETENMYRHLIQDKDFQRWHAQKWEATHQWRLRFLRPEIGHEGIWSIGKSVAMKAEELPQVIACDCMDAWKIKLRLKKRLADSCDSRPITIYSVARPQMPLVSRCYYQLEEVLDAHLGDMRIFRRRSKSP